MKDNKETCPCLFGSFLLWQITCHFPYLSFDIKQNNSGYCYLSDAIIEPVMVVF